MTSEESGRGIIRCDGGETGTASNSDSERPKRSEGVDVSTFPHEDDCTDPDLRYIRCGGGDYWLCRTCWGKGVKRGGEYVEYPPERRPLGTAEELGIAVFEGIDPSEVTIYDNGTHSGPPRWKETDKKFTGAAGMNHYLKAMFCPCGHFIRRVTYTDRPGLATVTCEGSTMTVEELQAELSIEETTEQTTLVAAADGGERPTGSDTDSDRSGEVDDGC